MYLRLCLQSHLFLKLLQLLFSSVQVHDFTLLPYMLVMVAVHGRVGALASETGLVEGEVGHTSVSPSHGDLVLLQVVIGNCG